MADPKTDPIERAFSAALATLKPTRAVARPDITLFDFTKAAWRIVEPSTHFVDGRHIHAITEHLEAVSSGQIRNLLINMPPRHMKSLLVSVFWPAWEWTFAPHRRWLYSSYALRLAIRDSVKTRSVIDSEWYQAAWGHRVKLLGANVSIITNDATGYRLATSVGGSATGEGGDRIVVDDPHNVNEAESELKREGAVEWWNTTMSTRGNDPRTVAKVVVMQRVHESDLSGNIIARGDYVHLMLPAEYELPKVRVA